MSPASFCFFFIVYASRFRHQRQRFIFYVSDPCLLFWSLITGTYFLIAYYNKKNLFVCKLLMKFCLRGGVVDDVGSIIAYTDAIVIDIDST